MGRNPASKSQRVRPGGGRGTLYRRDAAGASAGGHWRGRKQIQRTRVTFVNNHRMQRVVQAVLLTVVPSTLMSSMHGHDPYSKPRKVSFSDKLPAGLFAMTVATGGGRSNHGTDTTGPPARRLPPDGPSTPTPSTPPPRRARFQRSPYVSHVRAPSTGSDVDMFMPPASASTSATASPSRASLDTTTSLRSSDYDSPGPARYGGTLTPPRPRGRDLGWSVPRSPGPSPGADEYESDGRTSPSPSPRRSEFTMSLTRTDSRFSSSSPAS